jgi:hypothetical protein
VVFLGARLPPLPARFLVESDESEHGHRHDHDADDVEEVVYALPPFRLLAL